jgi:hypothetical protein
MLRQVKHTQPHPILISGGMQFVAISGQTPSHDLTKPTCVSIVQRERRTGSLGSAEACEVHY